MAGDDRLSNLSDDLLRCILHFAPAKEGAATSALARRWRSLWLSSGAVNLDSRSYDHLDDHDKRDVIVRDASKALAAAGSRGRPVTKFTFRYVEGEDDPWILLRKNDIEDAKHHMSGDLRATLYSQASRHLEELRLGLFFGPRSDGPRDLYSFSIPSLSSAPALRVLHVSKCLEWDWDRLCPSRPASVTPPTRQQGAWNGTGDRRLPVAAGQRDAAVPAAAGPTAAPMQRVAEHTPGRHRRRAAARDSAARRSRIQITCPTFSDAAPSRAVHPSPCPQGHSHRAGEYALLGPSRPEHHGARRSAPAMLRLQGACPVTVAQIAAAGHDTSRFELPSPICSS
uniref:F-box domain-containing protein n=1 Tax=Aegilops tauschii TaxID=37682 RepID=R7W9X3_AEGTA